MPTTTLNAIRAHVPCTDGWRKLLAHLGKTAADDELLSLQTILDSNGLDDALWCLRAMPQHGRHWRLYAVACARDVQHLMTNRRSIAALDVAERHARGEATDEELRVTGAAARAAAGDARAAAGAAARAAAGDARAAAWAAARAAATERQTQRLRELCAEIDALDRSMKMERSNPPAEVGSNAGLGVISRDEWESRYASRVRQCVDLTYEEAAECAREGATAYADQERGCGNAVVWWGGPSGANNTPEDEADEEMSYWTDDGFDDA